VLDARLVCLERSSYGLGSRAFSLEGRLRKNLIYKHMYKMKLSVRYTSSPVGSANSSEDIESEETGADNSLLSSLSSSHIHESVILFWHTCRNEVPQPYVRPARKLRIYRCQALCKN
jgi:hypothetical protein